MKLWLMEERLSLFKSNFECNKPMFIKKKMKNDAEMATQKSRVR
jgi:hypothetical protein